MAQFILSYLAILFVSSIFINGFYLITREGMVLGIWSDFLKGINPAWAKPLGNCITCMSSIYGTISWLFWYKIAMLINSNSPTSAQILLGFPLFIKIGLWILFCVCLAWVNEFIYNINNQHKPKNFTP